MPEFNKVLADFKSAEQAEDILPILTDTDIQRVVVAWPKIVIKPIGVSAPLPGSFNERWSWLWRHVSWCSRELQEISGVPATRFERIFRQAQGNRLIYPDGSISERASKHLGSLSLVVTARVKTELALAAKRLQQEQEKDRG